MFEGLVERVTRVDKEDLQMPNHLHGHKRALLELSFATVSDLLSVRKTMMPIAKKNKKNLGAMDKYAEVANAKVGFDIYDEEKQNNSKMPDTLIETSDSVVDIREYDVLYRVRVMIDGDIQIVSRCSIEAKYGIVSLIAWRKD